MSKNFDPKKLGEEADELIRNQGQKPEDSDTPSEETLEVVDDTDAGVEDAIAQADSTAALDQGAQSDEVTTDDAVAETSSALGEMQKQLDISEQRWKVLQGMITKKDEELDTMRNLLASMNQQPTQEDTAPAQELAKSLVTDADVKEYGKEYVDFITRVSMQVVRSELGSSADLASITARVALLEGSVQGVEQTSADTAQTIFFNELTAAVPNWRMLNNDASFLQWLDKVDPFTGETRLKLLQHAVASTDTVRAATFFDSYTSETSPAAPAQETELPASSGKDKLIAPGKAKATAPRPDEKRNWTRAAITKLYDDKIAGRITAKEFDKLERDLFAAQTDGLGRIAA